MTGIVAITMAGMGSRFTKAGYDRPKYEIEALGRPLFDWSMIGLEAFAAAGWRFRFAIRAGTDATPFIEARCTALGIEIDSILEIDHLTDGQATTALMLLEGADATAPVAIFNIDTFVAPGTMAPPAAGVAGYIPCFPGPGEGWSFVRLDASGRAVELKEKERISEHATVGLYGFDSVERYRAAYEAWFADGKGTQKGERYIAPMYNQMIAEGADVRIATLTLEDVGMLGTPDQLDAFIAKPPATARSLARGLAK